MRHLLTLFVIVGLTGCASAPPLTPEVTAGIKRVAVVSATADELIRRHVGVTVFGNEYEKRSISEWGADRVFEDQLGAAAEKVFSAIIVKVEGAAAKFSAVNDLNGPWSAPAFWGPNFEKIEGPARAFCQENTLDALIVVAKRTTEDILGGTNQVVSGAGIYTRPGRATLHLLSVVGLVDCRTGKTLALRYLAQNDRHTAGGERSRAVTLSLPESLARTPMSQWTPETEALVRSWFLSLPKDAWEDTLRTMVSEK